jgi:Tol biopolymer transport system component/tRNA A-37 threonylcarbamoyl transferase component Bud32
MPLTGGQVVNNRYRIVSKLGQGGMGAVYRAWDVNLDIPVALKEMVPDLHADPHTLAQLRQQFRREAQVVAGLDHPNLVRVIDYFTWGGSECLVMNFVEGESLAERIEREGTQPEAQVLEWARQLLDALTYCHARGVIHRDVKPQNVIITPEGRTVLVDFGLVKLWDPRDPRTQTVVRAMGTPEYAPPEQYSATAGHTDPRSDLYSLGATLYHTLTGQAPMSATDRMAMPERFASPRALAPYVSSRTEAAVVRAMELPITQRFSSAHEMANALRGPLPVHPSVAAPTKPARSHTGPPVWAWGLGGAVLLVGCLAGIGIVWRVLRGGDEPSEPLTPAVVQDTLVPERTPTPWVVVAPTSSSTSTPLPSLAVPASPNPASFSMVFDSYRDGNWEVYIIGEDGLGLVNLTKNPANDGDPAWALDGKRIAFDSDRDGNWEIYVVNTDGSGLTRLTNHRADDDSPAWSPDGSHVAFKSNRDGNWEIYVVNLLDSGVTNLTNHPSDDQVPAWSPDGQRIAFVSDRTGDWDIWVMNADGSGPTNLTRHPDRDSFPAWSPDGRRIAFHSYRDGNAEIYVMNADGSALARLTDHQADDWGPSWSPDGLRLAFTSDRDGDNEIYIMDIDGGSVVQVTHNDARDTWPVWSPIPRVREGY